MAPPSVNSTTTSGKIPTAEDVTTIGGVWAPTSAKRDRIKQLQAELEEGQESLDDAATKLELLDLHLSKGMGVIAKASDAGVTISPSTPHYNNFQAIEEWFDRTTDELPERLTQHVWNAFLDLIPKHIDKLLHGMPKTKNLQLIRDFIEEPTKEEREKGTGDVEVDASLDETSAALESVLLRHRLQLLQVTAAMLEKSWTVLTTRSMGDLDRSAVHGQDIEKQVSTLSKDALIGVLNQTLHGSCYDRFDAMWNLMDRDEDGLMDEEEVTEVCNLVISPVAQALETLLKEALEAHPPREPLPKLTTEETTEGADYAANDDDDDDDEDYPTGRRKRRLERRAKAKLQKLLKSVVKKHFEDEAEMPHRLRCIYAWAEKADQNNKIDAVHIDTGIAGRKRYVELNPKLSLEEFREVQQIHFPHLDRIGQEIMKSFHEELWIDQGRTRERTNLVRQSVAFLVGVSLIDILIFIL